MLVFGTHQTPAVPEDRPAVASHAQPIGPCDDLSLLVTCSKGHLTVGYNVPAVLPSGPTGDVVPTGDGEDGTGGERESGRRRDED